MGHVEIARRHLVQHGRKREEVVAVDQDDFDRGVVRQLLLQLDRRVQAAEAAAENHDSCWGVAHRPATSHPWPTG